MIKLLVSENLFSASMDGMHWHCFVDHQLETRDVDALEFVWHLSQCLVELKMFLGFDACDFHINHNLLADIHE